MSKPLFTMLQINDIHLSAGEDPRNNRGKLRALVEQIERPPDVLLLAGDIVDYPDEKSFRLFRELAAPLLGRVTLAVPGNHDVHPPDDPPQASDYYRLLGAAPLGQVVLVHGIAFFLLNDASGDMHRAPWVHARNRWLAEQLDAHAASPKIIVAHVPLVPLRDPEPLAESFAYPTFMNLDPHRELLAQIERHADSVLAVLSGHLHLSGRVERAGIQHIVPSGLMSWPGDSAYYEFYPDRVEVRMLPLPAGVDPGIFISNPLRNGIHDRHGREFTDSRHPSLEDYIQGLPEERAFTIKRTLRLPY